jgi:hypothetical protein
MAYSVLQTAAPTPSGGPTATWTFGFSQACTPGSLLVLISYDNLGVLNSVTGVSDGVNTWQRATSGTDSGFVDGEIWYAYNNASSSAVAVTVAYTGSANAALILREYGGIKHDRNPLDVVIAHTDNPGTLSHATGSTAGIQYDEELVVTALAWNNGSDTASTPTTSYANLSQVVDATNGGQAAVANKTVTGVTTTNSATWATSQTDRAVAMVATFQVDSGVERVAGGYRPGPSWLRRYAKAELHPFRVLPQYGPPGKYWVGGTGTWSDTAHWSTTSGGAGGAAVPSSSDDVFIDLNAGGGTITLVDAAACQSINFTGFSGTVSHPTASTLHIGGSAVGWSNIAAEFSSGMTYTTADATSAISFESTISSTQTVNFAGKTSGNVTYGTAGNSPVYSMTGTHLTSTTATVTHTAGTLALNDRPMTWGLFSSSNSNARTLDLGSSTITLIGSGTAFNLTTSTNLTLIAGTSLIDAKSTSGAANINSGGKTLYDVRTTKSSGGWTLSGGGGYHNVTQDNTVLGAGNRTLAITSATTVSVSGTLTYTAFDNLGSRAFMLSSTLGSTATVDLGTTGAVAMTNVDFRDMTFTGTNAPITGTNLGDGGGNSGITFPAATNRYWVGGTGSWQTTTNWSTTSGGSGGTGGASIPLLQDTAIFDASSFSTTGLTVTMGIMRACKLDATAATNSPAFNMTNPNGGANNFYGDVLFASGCTITCTGAAGGASTFTLLGRGSQYLQVPGITFPSNLSWSLQAFGGTYNLLSDLSLDATKQVSVSNGTFDANGHAVTTGTVSSSATTTRGINMGTGIWTLTSTGTIWNTATATNLTLNASTSTIIVSDTSATSKSLSRSTGQTFYDVVVSGGTGIVSFISATTSTIHNLSVTTPPANIRFNSPATYTFTGTAFPQGTAGNLITIDTNNAGTAATVSKSSGTIVTDYVSLKDSTATGGATWYAGMHSTSVSGNTGWLFSSPLSVTQTAKAAIGQTQTKTQPATARIAVTYNGRPWAYVQGKQTASGGITTVTVTMDNALALNSLAVIHIKSLSDLTSLAVTDNASVPNTYSLAAGPYTANFHNYQYYGVQTTAGATQITLTWTGTASVRLTVNEFSGGQITNARVFDKAATSNGSGSTSITTTDSFSPSTAGELIAVAIPGNNITGSTPGAGYTAGTSSSNSQVVMYRLSSTTSETAPITLTGGTMVYDEIAGAYFSLNPNLGLTQSAIARIAALKTLTQNATARIANAKTKTQPATARVADARTLTQGATARIATTRTTTQPATARIVSPLTKTQPATARFVITGATTQGAVARIANNRTITQPAVARIATSLTKTQPATARVAKNLTNTQTATARFVVTDTTAQGAVTRIANDRALTQSVTARIANSPTKTQGAIARVAKNLTSTHPATAKIAATVTKTQAATASIVFLLTSTQAATARISNTRTLTQGAIARILAPSSKTQPAAARIVALPTKTQPATGRIATSLTSAQPASARVATSRSITQPATAQLANSRTLNQSAIARVALTRTTTQTATGRISTLLSAPQPATGRIVATGTKTQPGIARVSQSYPITQPAVARVSKNPTTTQAATATVIRSGAGFTTQTGTSRIANNLTKTQPATARLAANKATSQAAAARIQITPSTTQPATAAILDAAILPGQATQPATAAIANSFTKPQAAIAAIGQTKAKSQPATARIIVSAAHQIFIVTEARIAKSRSATQHATAYVLGNAPSYRETTNVVLQSGLLQRELPDNRHDMPLTGAVTEVQLDSGQLQDDLLDTIINVKV